MYLLLLILFALRVFSSQATIEDELNDGYTARSTSASSTNSAPSMNVTVADCAPNNTDYLIWLTPLAYFVNHRASGSPDCFDWSSDGCSSSPNHLFGFDFEDCCQRHDFAYRNLRHQGRLTSSTREEADQKFLDDLKMVCTKVQQSKTGLCTFTRVIYFSAVRLFGNPNKAMVAFVVGTIVYILLVVLVVLWIARRHKRRVRQVKYYGTDHSSMTSTFSSIHSRNS